MKGINQRQGKKRGTTFVPSSEVLNPKDKGLFLKEWDLKEGQLTDQQILLAIKNGQRARGQGVLAIALRAVVCLAQHLAVIR